MEDVSLIDAKEQLADLMQRAVRGEDVRINDPQIGTVKLELVERPAKSVEPRYPIRVPGLMKGRVQIPEDKLLEPLSDKELDWLSGENSP